MDDKDRVLLEALKLQDAGMKIETIKVCPHCRQPNMVPKGKKMRCWKCGEELD